jgi:hypothetical protein
MNRLTSAVLATRNRIYQAGWHRPVLWPRPEAKMQS